jgi:hypothetical protein
MRQSQDTPGFVEAFRVEAPLPATPWLDCDTTPAIHSRRAKARRPEAFKAEAMRLLVEHDAEGQIGIYASMFGGPFYGYAIRYKGQAPFFEEPAPDAT